MEVTVRVPDGNKCFEDNPRYLCPFLKQDTFDYELIGYCGYLRSSWKLGGLIKRDIDFNKHPQCPINTQFSDYVENKNETNR